MMTKGEYFDLVIDLSKEIAPNMCKSREYDDLLVRDVCCYLLMEAGMTSRRIGELLGFGSCVASMANRKIYKYIKTKDTKTLAQIARMRELLKEN